MMTKLSSDVCTQDGKKAGRSIVHSTPASQTSLNAGRSPSPAFMRECWLRTPFRVRPDPCFPV
jgi:hypothetical protein